jgi:hypothetical protein
MQMFEPREYTAEEIKLLQEDDDTSSHAEMIVKAMGAFITAAGMAVSWTTNTNEDYGLVIVFKREEDLNQLLEGRKTLNRFSSQKPDPYIDPDAYAVFCNKINNKATRGELMASIVNVVMDHVPGKKRYAVTVDTTIPSNLDAIFCFTSALFCDQIAASHKLLHTIM